MTDRATHYGSREERAAAAAQRRATAVKLKSIGMDTSEIASRLGIRSEGVSRLLAEPGEGRAVAPKRIPDEHRNLILGYARAGHGATAIRAKLVDCGAIIGLSTIEGIIRAARDNGQAIPRHRADPRAITSRKVNDMLRPHAERRGIGVKDLVREIVAAVATGNLVDAVLDDGAEVQP